MSAKESSAVPTPTPTGDTVAQEQATTKKSPRVPKPLKLFLIALLTLVVGFVLLLAVPQLLVQDDPHKAFKVAIGIGAAASILLLAVTELPWASVNKNKDPADWVRVIAYGLGICCAGAIVVGTLNGHV